MGRPKKDTVQVTLTVGVSEETAARAKALAGTLSKRACGIRVSMAAVLRLALERGLSELEAKETLEADDA
jgi:hypothetical protein